MPKARAFISFDYDYDIELKNLLIGQSKNDGSPFEIADYSIKESSADWKEKARSRIKRVDIVIVICGKNTYKATGVSIELRIAQEENKKYFLLHGYKDEACYKPTSAKTSDSIYSWTWDNLKRLIHGAR